MVTISEWYQTPESPIMPSRSGVRIADLVDCYFDIREIAESASLITFAIVRDSGI